MYDENMAGCMHKHTASYTRLDDSHLTIYPSPAAHTVDIQDTLFPYVTFVEDDLPTDTASLPVLGWVHAHKSSFALSAAALTPEGLSTLQSATARARCVVCVGGV